MNSYLNALTLNPQFNPARIQVGNLYFRMKNYEQALLYFDQALAQDPNLPSAHGRIAIIKAERSNPRTFDPTAALNHAQMAYELSVDERTGQCNSPMVFDTLSFVFAVNGRLDQAIAAGTKALQLYTAQNLTVQAQRMKQQLNRYQQQKMMFSQPR
jgi:tetratricopeptide (TPR) repeat protein